MSADLAAIASRGACRDADGALFYGPDDENGRASVRREHGARAVCATCPVLEPCRLAGLRGLDDHGVWGGLSVSDREAIWRLDVPELVKRGMLPTVDGITLTAAELEAYAAKVNRRRGRRDCWGWTGSTNGKRPPERYGRFRVYRVGDDGVRRGRWLRAHRVALALWLGREPVGIGRHTCTPRTPRSDGPDAVLCVNGAHQLEGTQAQNVADMVAAGRHRNGASGPLNVDAQQAAVRVAAGTWPKGVRLPNGARAATVALLHSEGLTDAEITRRTGLDSRNVHRLRRELGLQSNYLAGAARQASTTTHHEHDNRERVPA